MTRSYICGGIAQLARAHGSYPWCREFKSPFRYLKEAEIPCIYQEFRLFLLLLKCESHQ